MSEKLNPDNDQAFVSAEQLDLEDPIATMDRNERKDENMFREEFPEGGASKVLPEIKDEITDDAEEEIEEEVQKDDQDADDQLLADITKEDLTKDELEESISLAEKAELERINRSLDTDYKSMDELKKAIHSEKNQKEEHAIQEKETSYNYWNQLLRSEDPIQILTKDLELQAINNKIDLKNEAEYEKHVTEKLEKIERDGTVDYAVRVVKLERGNQLNDLKKDIDAWHNTKQKTQAEKQEERKNKIEEAVHRFYKQDDYYGLKLEKQAYVDAYKKVSQGNLVKFIQDNPDVAVELQLFLDNRKNLASLNNSATYSDGVKAVMDIIDGAKPKSAQAVRNNKKGDLGVPSLIQDFLR